MKCVALLRGINVGGNNKIDMSQLKMMFHVLGYENVKTYINSGNVIFDTTKRSQKAITHAIEHEITKHFGLHIPVVVRSQQAIASIAKALPQQWKNDSNTKADVMFLWPNIDSPSITKQLDINKSIDMVTYVPGALLWKVEKAVFNGSGMAKVAASPLYKQMTVRNVNTLRKIAVLMDNS